MKFTPGPWFVGTHLTASENHKGFYIRSDSHGIALDVIPVDSDGIEGEANAHLIAASPLMYEALQDAETVIRECVPYEMKVPVPGISTKIRQALAKARGES